MEGADPYASIDRIIQNWADAMGSTLFRQGAGGRFSRFFHIRGAAPIECFQIAIFPPKNDEVIVQAASVDTNDDADLLQLWEGPVTSVDDFLREAVATVNLWKKRPETDQLTS